MGLRWRVLKNAAEDQKTKFIREQKKFYYKKWGDYIMGIDSLLRILQIAQDNLGLDLQHSNLYTVTEILNSPCGKSCKTVNVFHKKQLYGKYRHKSLANWLKTKVKV